MYRPNRIGPWPHFDTQHARWAHIGTDSAAFGYSGIDAIYPQIETLTLDDVCEFHLHAGLVTIQANDSIAYGCPIKADFITNTDYQFTISGALSVMPVAADLPNLNVTAFLAQVDSLPIVIDPTSPTNKCSQFIELPLTTQGTNFATINTSVIVTDIANSTLPFIGGWLIRTSDISPSNIRGSMSIQKYTNDLKVFDPNRN